MSSLRAVQVHSAGFDVFYDAPAMSRCAANHLVLGFSTPTAFPSVVLEHGGLPSCCGPTYNAVACHKVMLLGILGKYVRSTYTTGSCSFGCMRQ